VVELRDETPQTKSLVLELPEWIGHRAGQHVDVRLTAEDGYQAERSYSIASAPNGTRLELTVVRIADGEVSPYLTEELRPGDQFEVRGPIGGWFARRPDSDAPLLLVAGGSGVVPLMSMIRASTKVPVRLVYSVRRPADVIYASELSKRMSATLLDVTFCYTREAPPGARLGRISADVIPKATEPFPEVFVCGPSGFVETASSL
jgi:ferredoxin-NADP reductase